MKHLKTIRNFTILCFLLMGQVLAAFVQCPAQMRKRVSSDSVLGPAATLTVTKINDTNDGVCNSDCSLREAIAAANNGDTITFSSLFNTTQTITLTLGQLTINTNVTITGTGGGIC